MKVQELFSQVKFSNLRVVVSYTFDKGYEMKDIVHNPDIYADILDSEIKWLTKSPKYDLIIHI